ncbi:MAG TPA: DUF4292 domain-containing protein [Terracidiphilus sp.]|nr:DUF4292 domain-containing protein [Terracidiphilus sp.]
MRTVIRGMIVISALAGTLVSNARTQGQAPAQTAPASAQPALSADEVVSKYIDAIGGKAAISQVKSISMETSMQVMGNDAPGTTTVVDGVGYKMETDFNGSKIVQCVNDKGGWMINPMAGASDPAPMPDDQYKSGKDQIYIGGPLFDYASKGNKIEVVPGDPGTYKIKVTSKDNVETSYVIDAKTFLVKSTTRKGDMQGQPVDITVSYSDYRKADGGFLMPYAMDMDFGGQFQLGVTVKKVELNKTIDPAIFEMPKPAAAPAAAPAAPASKPSM